MFHVLLLGSEHTDTNTHISYCQAVLVVLKFRFFLIIIFCLASGLEFEKSTSLNLLYLKELWYLVGSHELYCKLLLAYQQN